MKSSIAYKLAEWIAKKTASRLAILKPLLFGVCLASFGVVAQAPLDVRVALIIGNAAYVNVPALSNSTNDAKSMANIMRKLGFKVFDVIDGDRASMAKAIDQMKDQLKGQQAVAMLYYAGHGLQLDWHNYMVPVDAKLNSSKDVANQTIDIETVIKTFKTSNTRMNIIVLDACRDNPFTDKASGKGLAQLDAPPGTFISFATSPGNVAEDGDSDAGNGLFTQFLIKELQKPAKIEDVFKRVRLQVRQKSQGRQIPWESTSLEDDFAFNDGAKHTFNPEDLIREAKEAKEKEERLKAEAEAAKKREIQIAQDREAERLKLIEAQKIQEQKAREKAEAESRERERQLALAAELEKKKAQEAAQALERAKVAEAERLKDIEQAKIQAELEARLRKESADKQFEIQKADWDKIKDSKNVDDFYAFLNKYPSGYITEQAQFAVEKLQKAKTEIYADKDGFLSDSKEARFRVGDEYEISVIDNNLNKEVFRYKTKVLKIEKGLVYLTNDFGNTIRTTDGAVLEYSERAGRYKYDPPFTTQPAEEFSIGKKFEVKTYEYQPNGGRAYRTSNWKITGKERLKLEFGDVNTYLVEEKSYFSFSSTSLENKYFYEPGWGIPMKRIKLRSNPIRPNLNVNETYVVVSRKRGEG